MGIKNDDVERMKKKRVLELLGLKPQAFSRWLPVW